MSVPAEMPDEVTYGPSSTHRASGTQRTRSLWTVACLKSCLFEVARRPSSNPARARIADPVHTDIVISADGARARRKSSRAPLSTWRAEPIPPGTRTRSSGGQPANPCSASVLTPGSEATGPGVSATVTMRTSGARNPNISSGPYRSSSSKSSYRTAPSVRTCIDWFMASPTGQVRTRKPYRVGMTPAGCGGGRYGVDNPIYHSAAGCVQPEFVRVAARSDGSANRRGRRHRWWARSSAGQAAGAGRRGGGSAATSTFRPPDAIARRPTTRYSLGAGAEARAG